MKNSEPIIALYLSQYVHELRYEAMVGTKYPDFSMWAGEAPIAFWEVADREFQQKDQERIDLILRNSEMGISNMEFGKTREMGYVETKIQQKSSQFCGCGQLPGMLLLPVWSGDFHLTGDSVMVATMGWPQIGLVPGDSGSLKYLRDESGQMVRPNTGICQSISAVGIVRKKNITNDILGVNDFFKNCLNTPTFTSEYAWELLDIERRRLIQRGANFEEETVYVEIYRNTLANIQWPTDLHGEYDQVYDLIPNETRPRMVFDGLAARQHIPIPRSETDLDLEAIMNDPLFRSD